MRFKLKFMYTNGKTFQASADYKPKITKDKIFYTRLFTHPEKHMVRWSIPTNQVSSLIVIDKLTGEISSNTLFKAKRNKQLRKEKQYEDFNNRRSSR